MEISAYEDANPSFTNGLVYLLIKFIMTSYPNEKKKPSFIFAQLCGDQMPDTKNTLIF